MKVRVIKIPGYRTLYALQQKKWYGWKELTYGSKDNALDSLKDLEEHYRMPTILVEKDI